MLKKRTVIEIMCVTFLILYIKNYEWIEPANVIENRLLKSDDGGVEDINTTRKMSFYQVAVLTKPVKKPAILCGGSVISKNYILTAAHCLQGANHATIILHQEPRIDRAQKTKFTLKSGEIKLHPRWNPNKLLNDIALVEVLKENYTEKIDPMQLATIKKIKNKKGTINGWKKDKHKKKSLDLIIHNVTIIENKECQKHFGKLVQHTNLCTHSDFKNGCHGFSGSPLIVDGIQVALVSFGTDRCNIGYPTVYTRVYEYRKWIEENSDITAS